MFDRVCIVGVGLIGGSIALAARKSGLCQTVIGIDLDQCNRLAAQELGAIDIGIEHPQQLEDTVDLVIFATPVGSFETLFRQLQNNWSDTTIYTDTGSTKQNVLESVKSVFGKIPANFVPGHPIAGGEKSGVLAANSELYRNRRVILTPVSETDPAATDQLKKFWRKLGAEVSTMNPRHHDSIFAATSHLPHVIAFSLVDMLGKKDEKDEILQYAAAGFKDFTRLASSDPKMWRDICLANHRKIIRLIEEFKQELTEINKLLEDQQSDELLRTFQSANDARKKFLEHYESR